MFFPEIHIHFARELRAPRALEAFRTESAACLVLRRHGSPVELLAVFRDRSPGRVDERERLTLKLIATAQRDSGGPWSTVLLVAFLPMLRRLRGSIRGDALDSDDLDQLVLTSFLEAVASYPLDRWTDRSAMRLKQSTRRGVFTVVGAEQEIREQRAGLASLTRELGGLDPFRECASGYVPNPIDEADAVAIIDAHLCRRFDAAHRDLVVRTTVGGVTLARYVDELYPGLPPVERRRVYERLKRQRSRALRRIRESLLRARTPAERDVA